QVFASEGIVLSTIGLGEDFNEDLLAALARIGRGRFRYAPRPADLAPLLQATLAPDLVPVARDITLTITYKDYCEEVTAHGWTPAESSATRLTQHLPHLYAGQTVSLLASARNWHTYI